MSYGIGEIVFFVGKATIVLSLALIVCCLLRKSNPRWQVHMCRQAVIMLLICGLLSATPFASAWGPSFARQKIPFQSASFVRPPSMLGQVQLLCAEEVAEIQLSIEQLHETGLPVDATSVAVGDDSHKIGASLSIAPRQRFEQPFVIEDVQIDRPFVASLLLSVWGVVAIFLTSLRLLASYHVQKMVRCSTPLPNEIALTRTENLLPRLSQYISSPTVVGCFQPTILIPTWMCQAGGLAEQDIRAACAHEQAHVWNSDLFWIHLFEWISIGLWFHPLVYLMKAIHRSACERVADSDAATYLGDAQAYAASLARVALRVFANPSMRGAEVAMLAMVSPLSRKRSSAIALRLRFLRKSRPAERLGKSRFGCALGAFAAAIAIGTLGLVETPIVAAPSQEETQKSDSTLSTADHLSLVAQADDQPTVQVAAAEQLPNEQAASRKLEKQTSVHQAFVTTPDTLPAKDELACVISASGVVRDTSGRVHPGVHVALIAAHNRVSKSLDLINPIVAHTTTNAAGAFSFVDVVSVQEMIVQENKRRWRIVAVSPDDNIGWANVESTEQPASITQDIVLRESTSVEGKLVDEHAQPLVGATIQANYWATADEIDASNVAETSSLDIGLALNEVNLVATTDPSGNFNMDGLPASSLVKFTIRHPSIVDKRIFLSTTDTPSELNKMHVLPAPLAWIKKTDDAIVCESGTLVSGQVLDETGQVVEATISLWAGGMSLVAKTNDGKFNLRVPSGDASNRPEMQNAGQPFFYTMRVSPLDEKGIMAASAKFEPGELNSSTPLNFVLRKKSEYSGRIVNSAGQGVSGVGVLVRTKVNSGATHQRYVQPQPAQAFARATSDTLGNFKILLPEGDIEFLLSGRVPGFDLVQYNRYEDQNGRLYEWPNNLNPTHTAVVRRTDRQLADFTVRSTEPVSLRVVGPSGQPLAGAIVSMLASPGVTGGKKLSQHENKMVAIAEQVTTDGEGRCRIVPFAQPDYTTMITVIFKDSQSPMMAKFSLDRFLNVVEELKRGVAITAQPALHISGRVTVDGEPLDNIWINVGHMKSQYVDQLDSNGRKSRRLHTYQQAGEPLRVQTNPEGFYEGWVDAKATNWSISLNAGIPNDYRQFPAHDVDYLDPFHAQANIELKRGKQSLVGKVIDQEGKPISRASVTVVGTEEFDPTQMFDATKVTTHVDGTFKIAGILNPGDYALYVSLPNPNKGSRPATIMSEVVTASTGEAVTIRVNLGPQGLKP